MARTAALLAAALLGSHGVSAESKRKPPVGQWIHDVQPAPQRQFGPVAGTTRGSWRPTKQAPLAGQDCSVLPGTWTGYASGTAIGDAYSLQWRGGEYGPGAYSAMYISHASWSLGLGQLSPDNATLSIVLDGGRVAMNGTLADNCSTILWDNDTQWKKTVRQATTTLHKTR